MRFNSLIKITSALSFLTIGLLASAPAMAQTQTITAQAVVTDACTLGTAAGTLNFGTLASGVPTTDETSTINVDCNPGAPWTVSAAVGAGTDETDTNRLLTGAVSGSTVAWELYKDAACTDVWGATTGTTGDVMTGTGTGAMQSEPICGKVVGSVVPNVIADTYSEAVTITLSFT